jgi:hypothetical protein
MFKLFTCEWLRIYRTIAIATLIHFLILGLLINFGLFSSDAIGFKMSLVLFYSGCGFLLGITQINKYTKPAQWTYYINRPVSPKTIYIAFFIAAFTAITVVIVFPFFAVTLLLDSLNKEIIDQRHYIQLAYILGVSLSFYLLACYTTLSQKRSSFLLIMLILLPIISINMGGSVYWLLTGVISVLFIMVNSIIKVNLNGEPKGISNRTITALAYQYSLYFILTSVFFLISEVALDIEYRSKDKTLEQTFDSNSFRDIIFLNKQDSLITGLHTENNQHQELIEEIKLGQAERIRKRIWFHPTQQQLPFMDENKTLINDDENQIIWQFSHDLMLFVGKESVSKKIVGYLGPNQKYLDINSLDNDQVFTSIPWVSWISKNQIVVKNKIYQYQNSQQSFRLLFSASDEEYLLNVLQSQGSIKTIITTNNVYIFDSIDYDNDLLPLQARLIVPLPGDYNNLWDVKVTEVIDRFILSFLYGKSTRHDIYSSEQLVYEFTLSGEINFLNKRSLIQSPSMLIKDLDYYISPAWKLALDYFPLHPSKDRYLQHRPQVSKLSQSTITTLILIAIFYASFTFLLSRGRNLNSRTTWTWVLINTVAGLPGILSFVLLNPKLSTVEVKSLQTKDYKGAQNV